MGIIFTNILKFICATQMFEFIFLLEKYCLSVSYVPGSVLRADYAVMYRIDMVSLVLQQYPDVCLERYSK